MPTSRNQKQVRFAYRNTFHSPVCSPLTPALTFAPSIPSSTGPITPPQMSNGLPGPSPFIISLPANHPHYIEPLRPHPLLESAAVNWDLMENSSTITLNNYLLSSRLLVEQATSPPLPSLSIISIHLPWTINVYASNGSYVTLEDLFDSVYRSLRTNITPDEFNSLPHQNDQKRATRAYEQRYRRFRNISAHDEEKRGGMKRIDFLMGRTRFHSISSTGRRADEWRLNVSWSSLPLLERQSYHPAFSILKIPRLITIASRPKDFLSISVLSMLVPFHDDGGWLSPTSFSFQWFLVPITYTSGIIFLIFSEIATSFINDTPRLH